MRDKIEHLEYLIEILSGHIKQMIDNKDWREAANTIHDIRVYSDQVKVFQNFEEINSNKNE